MIGEMGLKFYFKWLEVTQRASPATAYISHLHEKSKKATSRMDLWRESLSMKFEGMKQMTGVIVSQSG
jgi:hypothetical protein